MEDLSSRTAQEVLDDHLEPGRKLGGEWASSAASRRISAATHRRT